MKFSFKHSIWLKAIVAVPLCLFLVTGELLPIESGAMRSEGSSLQVQSIFSPILDEIGWKRASQMKMEALMIIIMARKYNTMSFQDINAAFDRCYHPVFGQKRLFNITSNISKKGDKIFIALSTNTTGERQKEFMMVLDAKKTDGDGLTAIDAIIPELNADEVACSPEDLYDHFIGNPENMAAKINKILNAASSGKNEATIEKPRKNKEALRINFFKRKTGNDIVWAFKKENLNIVAKIFDLAPAESSEYSRPTMTISSESGEIIEGPSVHQLMKKAHFRKEIRTSQTIKDLITAGNGKSQFLFNDINTYLSRKEEPVDIVIDLSLIPKADLEENMKTWAYLILSCRDLKNINFVFEADPIHKAASETEALALLRKNIKDDLLFKRISAARRENAIQVPIVSKALLERMGLEGIGPNQYPVALDNINVPDRITLNNFQAALVIGLAKAAMAIAKKRDKGKEKNDEKELPKLIESLLPRLQKIYSLFRKDVILTEATLNNMIDDDPLQRLNRALELYLPPIVHMQIEKLRDMHSHIQLLLQAA